VQYKKAMCLLVSRPGVSCNNKHTLGGVLVLNGMEHLENHYSTRKSVREYCGLHHVVDLFLGHEDLLSFYLCWELDLIYLLS
jgi:hypothetical protein